MKVGTDGTLLGAWARGGKRILDVGTGTGLIVLMMAQRFPAALLTGIDIDGEAVVQARENVAASPFASRASIELKDFSLMTPADCGLYDAIVSNPPFFADSLRSPDARRSLARHTASLTYRQLMGRAWQLLAPHGELSVVVPADSCRLMESEALLAGFFKVRHCMVRTTASKPPKRAMMAFRKHSAPTEHSELTIGSAEYTELTKDFYL